MQLIAMSRLAIINTNLHKRITCFGQNNFPPNGALAECRRRDGHRLESFKGNGVAHARMVILTSENCISELRRRASFRNVCFASARCAREHSLL